MQVSAAQELLVRNGALQFIIYELAYVLSNTIEVNNAATRTTF
jgi:hypothetical protein